MYLRYARWDLSRIDLVDPRADTVLCPIYPLDRSANSDGQRRLLDDIESDQKPPVAIGMAPLMRQLLAEYSATGLPPAHLPTDHETNNDEKTL